MDRWFSKGLIEWYGQNKRDLPWRREKDPYRIWLSEIILQQTQVSQGISYYLKFIQKYPTVPHLAKAKEDEVLKMWQGLGYYSRARNLHSTAKIISTQFGGHFPTQFEQIRALKGIGDYTAAAIASFAFDLSHAAVDGNVYRVLSRVFGISTPIDSGKGKKEYQLLANLMLNKKEPALHNQAIMEFGALFCRPQNPDCQNCIFRTRCSAHQSSRVSDLPVKLKKGKIKNRFFNYLIIVDDKGKILLNKRGENDIWQGLYEFTLIENNKEMSPRQLFASRDFKHRCPSDFEIVYTSEKYKHILTHQHLFSRFYVIRTKKTHAPGLKKSTIEKLDQYAFPRLIEKFLNDCDLREII